MGRPEDSSPPFPRNTLCGEGDRECGGQLQVVVVLNEESAPSCLGSVDRSLRSLPILAMAVDRVADREACLVELPYRDGQVFRGLGAYSTTIGIALSYTYLWRLRFIPPRADLDDVCAIG